MKVALIGNTYQAEKSRYLMTIIEQLRKHGVKIIVERHFLAFITSELGFATNDLDAFDDEGYSQLVKDEEFDPGLPEDDV